MTTDPANSILNEPDTTFEIESEEVKDIVDELAEDASPDAVDQMYKLAKDKGISVTPNMTAEEIKDQVHDVL